MKRLSSQFDNQQFGMAVATPTCSSCCCCCCCLATIATTSTLLARRVNRVAKQKNVASRWSLVTLSLLFIPATVLLTAGVYNLINNGFRSCEQATSNIGNSPYTYNVCRSEVNGIIPFLWGGLFIFILWYIYSRARMATPLKRSILVTIMFHVCFAIEFGIGLFAVLSTAGIAYLFLVPIIVGWINHWYTGHLANNP